MGASGAIPLAIAGAAIDAVGDREFAAEIGNAQMAREGAKIDFLGDEALAEQRRVGADPAAFGDPHRLQQHARPDALAGEEGDLGRDFAAAFADAARSVRAALGTGLVRPGIVPERRRPRPLA